MTKIKTPDPKIDALRQQGTLNVRPEKVIDPLFMSSDFFDSRDLVQVKYEMVRRVRTDGQPVSQSVMAFGFSRPSFYQAQEALEAEGLAGLIPEKPGPRRSHKLSTEVMEFLKALLAQEPSLSSSELVNWVEKNFKLKVHSRSIERALARQEKKQSRPMLQR